MPQGFFYLIAIAIHEAFHILAGYVIFRERLRIFFMPVGFRASWENFQPDKWVQCVVCAAGPAGNLFAAAIAALLPAGEGNLTDFLKANLVIGLFNLIPLYPMDGGSIVLILLYHGIGSIRTSRIAVRLGWTIRIILIITGFIMLVSYNNPSMLLTVIFLPGNQYAKRSVNLLNLSALLRRRERILKKRVFPVRHILLLKDVNLGEAVLFLDYDRYHIIHIADDNLGVLTQITEQQLIDAIMDLNAGKTLEEAFILQE